MKGMNLLLFLIVLPAASAAPSAILSGTFSSLLRWLWSSHTTPSKADRTLPQFEKGYAVETVLEGHKVGIKPYAIQLSPDGEVLILDSGDSNIFQLTPPLSRYSRVTLVAGSRSGYSGYVDGSPKDARFNHPMGFAIDARGNIYVADTENMAIRKISESGVTTIAGGRAKRTGHVDGPSEDAKFSNDFDVKYFSSTCSLLIVDRGNQAIREIQLHSDDCGYSSTSQYSQGILSIAGALSLGYLLGMFQQGMGLQVFTRKGRSSKPNDEKKPSPGKSKRPPVLSHDDDAETVDSIKRNNNDTWPLPKEDVGIHPSYENYQNNAESWSVKDSYDVSEGNQMPKSVPKNKYSDSHKGSDNNIRSSGSSKPTQNRQAHSVRVFRSSLNSSESLNTRRGRRGEYRNHSQYLKHERSAPETYYEESCDSNTEVVFGAVEEMMKTNNTVEVIPVNHNDPMYDHYNIRSHVGFGSIFDF